MPEFLARRERPLVLAAVGLHLLTYATLSIARHRTFHSFGLDLGLFNQLYWNSVHGRLFESTMSFGGPAPHSFFGDHFSPMHLLLMPFYALWPHPETLLVLQSAAVAAGAWPLYLMARSHLQPGFQRLVFVVAYFLALPVAYVNLSDFHETAFAILPLGLALHYLDSGRTWAFVAALAATFLVKEEMPLIGVAFGVYAFARGRPALGLGVAAVSAAAFAAIVGVVVPAFAGGRSYTYFASRYGDLGTTPIEMLRTLATRPVRVARVIEQRRKLLFVIGIFGPTLFLTVLSGWAVLLVLPTLAYLLLSSYAPQFSFAGQYAAPLVPLVVGTAVLGFARLPERPRPAVALAVLASCVAFSVVAGDEPFSSHFDWSRFRPEGRYESFAAALDRIPGDASVAAERNLAPHLSSRRLINEFEYTGAAGADWVALDWAVVGRDRSRHETEIAALEAQGYSVVARSEGLALLRRT